MMGGSVPNNIFPSTLVGSSLNVGSVGNSLSFGSQLDTNRLPPGSAGFGTVETVDLGSVSIQSTLQNQNLIKSSLKSQNQVQFPTGNDPNELPDYNQFNAQQSLLNNNNFNQPNAQLNIVNAGFNQDNINNFNQPNAQLNVVNAGFNQVNPTAQNFGNNFNPVSTPQSFAANNFNQPSAQLNIANGFNQVDPPQNLASNTASVNIQVTDQFAPNFGTSAAGTHQTFRETFPVDVALPVNNGFRASSPLNQQTQINPNQPWVGSNNQQQLLFSTQQQQQQFLPQLQQSQIHINTGSIQTTERPFALNERPVRFTGDASNRFDQDYEFDSQVYYDMPFDIYTTKGPWKNDNTEQQNYITPAPTSNIMAELAKYSNKKNIFYRPATSDPYIQYPSADELQEPDKELIMYPSGQLIVGPNNAYPTTIGPYLRNHLAGQQSLQHGQKPHYVVARKKAPEYESKTELFDPLIEGDEIIERSESVISETSTSITSDKEGLWPMLIRTAKDDLKLVGDVIKLALSR